MVFSLTNRSLSKIPRAWSVVLAMLLLLSVLPTTHSSGSEIYVSSDITSDTTWSNGDVVHINGLIHVLSGITLSILPGAIVKFDADSVLYVDSGAKFNAIGSQGASIIFTSNSSIPNVGDWNKIQFAPNCISSLEYVKIEYATTGINILGGNVTIKNVDISNTTTGVQISDGNLSIENATMNVWSGLKVIGSISPTISNSTIISTGESFSLSNGATAIAINCTFDVNKVVSSSDSKLIVKKYLDLRVQWSNATGENIYPAEGADVYINATDGTCAFEGTTNQLGEVGTLTLTTSIITQGPSFTNQTPYYVNVSKNGIYSSVQTNLTLSMCIVSLIDDIPPSLYDFSLPNDYSNSSSFYISGNAIDNESGLLVVKYSTDGAFFSVADGLECWYANFTLLSDGVYEFVVRVYDLVGNYVSVSKVFTLDATPPEFVVLTPEDGYRTNKKTIWINATLSEPVDAEINGVQVSSMSSTFNVTFELSEGWNYFSINLTDIAGNIASTFRNIFYDIGSPEFVIVQPINNSITTNDTIEIYLITEAWAQISISGSCAGSANETGEFKCHRTLVEGENIIWISVRDFAGNVNITFIKIILDTTKPEILLVSPENGSIVNSTTVTLSGKTEIGCTLTVAGIPVLVEQDGNFSVELSLVEGINEIDIISIDQAGNVNETNLTLYVDTLPPELYVTYAYQGNLMVLVSGITLNCSHLYINGTEIFVEENTFSYNWTVVEGENMIIIEAVDNACNRNSTTINYICDITPPLLNILNENNSVVSQRNITLVGYTEKGATLTIDNKIVSVSKDGSFSYNYTLLDGNNSIKFSSCDQAGNYANKTLNIFLDLPPYVAANINDIVINDTETKRFCITEYILDNLTASLRWIIEGVNTELYNVSLSACEIIIRPVKGANGTDTFQVTAYDERNQSITVDIIVIVRYQPPHLGNITGRILDEDSKPVADAQVNLEGDKLFRTMRSDADGKFFFEEVPEGNYLVRITKAGFKQKLVSVNVLLGLETPIGDITVKKEIKETKSDDTAYGLIFAALFAIVIVMLAFLIIHHKKKEDEQLEKEFLKPTEDKKDKDKIETKKEKDEEIKDEDEIDEGPLDDEEDKEEVPITNEEEAEVDDSVICILCNSVISSKEATYSCDCGKVMHDECASKEGKCPKCNARYVDK